MENEVISSAYHFTNGVPLVNFSQAILVATNGGLTAPITNSFTFDAHGKATPTGGSTGALTIATATGAFKATVVDSSSSNAVPASGVILQKQSMGRGVFVNTNQTGQVYFGPSGQ